MPHAIAPASLDRRSPVYRWLTEHGARFTEVSGGAVASGFGASVSDEVAAARSLAVADLSPYPRIGFNGPGVHDWLRARGISGLDDNNHADRQAAGDWAVRLGPGEALILGAIARDGGLCARLTDAWSRAPAPGCYPVLRGDSHFWFIVAGAHAAALLAKLCGVDLRPDRFADGSVAQTSVARLGTVVVRADLGAVPAFHLLGDSASAEYFCGVLDDAMAEFNGRLVGLTALRELAEP